MLLLALQELCGPTKPATKAHAVPASAADTPEPTTLFCNFIFQQAEGEEERRKSKKYKIEPRICV
jgi:hypothetical protein